MVNKMDALLFRVASQTKIDAEKDAVWTAIAQKRAGEKKMGGYALRAAVLIGVFAAGLFAGIVSQRGHIIPAQITVPQTDELNRYEFLEDAALASPLSGGGIEALLPRWAPDGLPRAEADSDTSWHTGVGETKWVRGELAAGDELRPEFTAGLRAGCMRCCLVYENGSGELIEIQWAVRTTDGNYLWVSSGGISYEEGVKLIESIAG